MVVSAGAATALPFATTAAAVLLEPVAIVLLDPVATVPGIVPAGPALADSEAAGPAMASVTDAIGWSMVH